MSTHFILELLKYLSPVIAGGIAYLIVRDIQFFRRFKKEKDMEFKQWLQNQESGINTSVETFKDVIREYLDQHEHEARHSKINNRLTKIENLVFPMNTEHKI